MVKSHTHSNKQGDESIHIYGLSSTVTAKGQATIPLAVRKKLDLKPGDQVGFIEQDDKIYLIPLNKSLASLKGLLRKPKKALSLNEMNKIIGEGYVGN